MERLRLLEGKDGHRVFESAIAARPGQRRFLELPACAGGCAVFWQGAIFADLGPAWTLQTVELPADAGKLRLKPRSDTGDPFRGFLAWCGLGPRGLWQGAWLRHTGPAAFLAFPDSPRARYRGGFLEIAAPWSGPENVRLMVHGPQGSWQGMPGDHSGRLHLTFPPPHTWNPRQPEGPRQTTLTIELWAGDTLSQRIQKKIGWRSLRVQGERILLNGEALLVRGLLHWGYYPELPGPAPAPETLRQEIRGMKARGFNLLKCCLFLPPQEFLQVCDEEGMLVWNEYPLWAGPLHGPAMVETYRRFARHDAGHPCVILRTLTCENDRLDGPTVRAALAAVRAEAPDGLLNDHSGWLDTHVAEPDFYDEHPYLHCAQWPHYLERTRRALAGRPARPLLLGETMAFDSGRDLLSRRVSLAVRRRQAESFCAAFPNAGYVLCTARDSPLAPIGVQDERGRWKNSAEEWRWQKQLDGRGAAGVPPPSPSNPHQQIPPEVLTAKSLLDPGPRGGTLLQALQDGARVLHLAGTSSGSWRAPEHLFWSPVPLLRGPAAAPPLLEILEDELFFELLSGRVLLDPPAGSTLVLAAVRDFHAGRGRYADHPLILAARVGRGRLLVSGLATDGELARRVHAALCESVLSSDLDLPVLELAPPPRSFFLDGPWRATGATLPGGSSHPRTGTLRENRGANAFQGWAEFRSVATLPPDWPPRSVLRAEAVGDGWELFLDGRRVHAHGNLSGTWDAGRDRPCTVDLSSHLRPGAAQEWRFRVKDHRGAGGLIGPIYLCAGDPEAGLLY